MASALAPTSQYDSPQGEAAGHAYVQLAGTGQYVQWTNNTGQPVNFINVRASVPDAPGGIGHSVADNYIADTARYIGLGVGRFGVNGSDMLGATVSGNVIVRSGGNAYNQGQPALHVGNGGDGQNTGTVTDATVTDNTIIQSVYDAIGFSTSTNTDLADNTIISPWRNGIMISPPFYPAPSGNATITGNYVSGVGSGLSAFSNDSSGFTTSLSSNSWQNGASAGAYGGSPAAVPGTAQAANYDTGGQGVAYNVTSANGTGNSYRPDGVDLETCTDTGCGDHLGWTATGQWFRYTTNVASAGTYTVTFRVASPNGASDAFHLADTSGDDLTGAQNVPATGGWQTWATITDTVTLAAGRQTLVVDQDNGGWNIRYLTFAPASASAALTASPTSVSFGKQTDGTTSAAQAVTISNTGTAAASISSIAAAAPFAETSNCGSSLAAGASCAASVTFSPGAAQAYNGALTLSSNATDSTLTVALAGTGASSGSTNLALNAPVTASSTTSGYPASNAVDGSTSTYWEGTDGVWPTALTVNLGAADPLTSVVIDLPPSAAWSTRTQTLPVLGSTNDSTWTTLVSSATYTWNPSTGNTVTIALPPGTTDQYVELSVTANSVQNGAQVSELYIYS